VLSPPELVERPGALFEPLLSADPELLSVFHDVCEDGTAEEDHMFPARRVLDTDLEFLRVKAQKSVDGTCVTGRDDVRLAVTGHHSEHV
jgi:hypothetical protein